MARRLARITPEAAFWLKEEIAYIADKQPSAARKIAAKIRAARRQPADFPLSGQPGVIPGTRRLVVDPYIVTLRYKNGVVEIAAIRHAQQGDAYAPREVLDKAANELSSEPDDAVQANDSALVRRIVEVAGRERLAEAHRRGLAAVLTEHAAARGLDIPGSAEYFEALLAAYADEKTLRSMVRTVDEMTDLQDFVKGHGVTLPGYSS